MEERNEQFDEWLDELYPPYIIGSLEFYPSDILFELDPIAYRCSINDWESFIEEDELV